MRVLMPLVNMNMKNNNKMVLLANAHFFPPQDSNLQGSNKKLTTSWACLHQWQLALDNNRPIQLSSTAVHCFSPWGSSIFHSQCSRWQPPQDDNLHSDTSDLLDSTMQSSGHANLAKQHKYIFKAPPSPVLAWTLLEMMMLQPILQIMYQSYCNSVLLSCQSSDFVPLCLFQYHIWLLSWHDVLSPECSGQSIWILPTEYTVYFSFE